MKDNMKTRSIKINGIENLKVREIKGLITTKNSSSSRESNTD